MNDLQKQSLGEDRLWPSKGNGSGAHRQEVFTALPNSVEAERGVLGSILLSPRTVIVECQEKSLREDHFYIPAHATIFTVLVEIHEAGGTIDLITFTQILRDKNLLETVGGASFVTSLFSFVPTAAHVGYYLDIVQEKFLLRELIAVCTGAVRRAYEEQDEVRLLIDDVQAQVTALALDNTHESTVKPVGPVMVEVMEEMKNAYKHRGRTTGLATGFVHLDRMTMGLQPGEMIVVGARPSMGKTSLIMNMIEHIALDRYKGDALVYKGQPVLIFSIETAMKRLMRRSAAARARINLQDIRLGLLSEEKLHRLHEACCDLGAAPIFLDDSPALKIHELKARARRYVALHGVQLIVVDYLQLAKSPSKRAEFSKTLEVSEVSQGIKEIGRELNVAMLVAAQLNRDTERRDPRPQMTNLRESGQIEQDADLIMLLHRAEYYLEQGSKEQKEVEGEAELIVAKQKDGPVGTIALTFLKEFTRFEDRAAADGSAMQMFSNNPQKRQGHEGDDF